jgi:hypothetical protein
MSNQIALINLPTDFVPQIASTTSILLGDFSPYLYLVLGVLLLTAVVGSFISHLKS